MLDCLATRVTGGQKIKMRDYDVVIIGAGGAGMMCALEAARRYRKVVLLDHSEKIGRKILISGGGRCNFTNIHCGPENFVSQNPHFAKSALSQFSPQDFINLVRKHQIRYHEKKLGQLFCDDSASQIVDMLVSECLSQHAEFELNCRIDSVSKSDRFEIETSKGRFKSDSLVVATGGLSIPQIGATGFGYEIARQFGLKLVQTAPALDGFNLKDKDLREFTQLSGISLDTIVTCNKASFRENVLFTHNGLSGPASLQASLYWRHEQPLEVNLLPDLDPAIWLSEMRSSRGRVEIKNVLADVMPRRFAEKFCELHRLKGPLAEIGAKQLEALAVDLSGWKIVPTSTVGYRKAEVTRGGVDTNALSSKTMESKKVPGLFFIGEVIDVTGQLGGHNFQWAWASGFAAGQNA